MANTLIPTRALVPPKVGCPQPDGWKIKNYKVVDRHCAGKWLVRLDEYRQLQFSRLTRHVTGPDGEKEESAMIQLEVCALNESRHMWTPTGDRVTFPAEILHQAIESLQAMLAAIQQEKGK